jgi:RNA polymerase sigma-70 factor (ECF subfamily)
MVELCDQFLSRLEPSRRSDFQQLADLAARLRAMIDAARSAHPALPLDEAHFLDAVAERVEDDLGAIHAADLHLALACARGEPAAIAAFDQAHGSELDAAIASSPSPTRAGRQRARSECRTLGVFAR